MESLVVSLETAKALKVAGFPQETACIYYSNAGKCSAGVQVRDWVFDKPGNLAAPTAQELADQLDGSMWSLYPQSGGKYMVSYQPEPLEDEYLYADTMAEALANLYLAVKEAK